MSIFAALPRATRHFARAVATLAHCPLHSMRARQRISAYLQNGVSRVARRCFRRQNIKTLIAHKHRAIRNRRATRGIAQRRQTRISVNTRHHQRQARGLRRRARRRQTLVAHQRGVRARAQRAAAIAPPLEIKPYAHRVRTRTRRIGATCVGLNLPAPRGGIINGRHFIARRRRRALRQTACSPGVKINACAYKMAYCYRSKHGKSAAIRSSFSRWQANEQRRGHRGKRRGRRSAGNSDGQALSATLKRDRGGKC